MSTKTKLIRSACWLICVCVPLVGAAQPSESTFTSADESAVALPTHLLHDSPRNVEDFRVLERHIKLLQLKVRPATVALSSGGSGVVITADGYVLTCAHVNQRPGRTVTVTFPDGKQCKAITMGNNHGIDAGLVKITDEGEYPFVAMGRSTELKPGQWCLAVGYPVSFARGREPAIRLGRVLANKPRMIVTDCTIMGGDSGGPLFDLHGNVVGISSRVNGSIETNIHVPVDTYQDTWDRLVASMDWSDEERRSYLGITRDDQAEKVVIKEIKPNSPAERGGLRVGDTIVSFDGDRIVTFSDLLDRMEQRKPQDRVALTIIRDERSVELTVELDYWPTNQD